MVKFNRKSLIGCEKVIEIKSSFGGAVEHFQLSNEVNFQRHHNLNDKSVRKCRWKNRGNIY